MIELSEKFLVSLGGWDVMKRARAMHASGNVADAEYAPPVLKAKIHETGREFTAALRIRNSIDIENLCPCKESRGRGLICAHVVAAGLSVLDPRPVREPAHSSRKSEGMEKVTAPLRPKSNEVQSSELPSVTCQLEGSLRHLVASIDFSYPSPDIVNPAAEARIMQQFLEAGFVNEHGKAVLKGEDAVLKFYASDLHTWMNSWNVTLGERFQHVTKDFLRIRPVCRMIDDGSGWLDFHIHHVAGSDAVLQHADVKRLIASGGVTRLKNGKVVIADHSLTEDIDEVLRDCNPVQERGRYRIDPVRRGYLEASITRWSGTTASQGQAQRIPLGPLSKLLRPYQIDGAQWLVDRAAAGTGGLLADDMGLGKTVQALAMIEAIRLSGDHRPSLVICPSSLVWNWQSEAARFLPELPVLAISGADRGDAFPQISSSGLVITSYALLRRDAENYRPHEFSTIILDEAQHIKNPDSQSAKSALQLRGRARFILTGTPVENALSDLWSLFEFLLPGYLGPRKDFKSRYEEPLAANPPQALRERFARLVNPFVLRRMKSAILDELPPKLEQIIEVELSAAQKSAYTAIQQAARDHVDALRKSSGDAPARMAVLTALLRLRQVSCDLRLVQPEFNPPESASSKIEALRELLAEAIDGGHRVLVFSQFTKMLDQIADALSNDTVKFCRLDGSTKNREAVVQSFQSDPDIPVFLISLKAGGVGLNLTGADTVIHFDPWWNPAAEAQATDRAHRIGQQNVVTSIKLIARDTVEQRVLALQNRKRALFENALNVESLSENFSFSDLVELIG